MKRFFAQLALLCVCFALLFTMSVPAMAEEIFTAEGEVDLYSEGKFPQTGGVSFYSTDDLADYLYSSLLALETDIDVSSYSLKIDDIRPVYQNIINSHPEMFYVTGSFSYSAYTSSGIVVTLAPKYIDDLSDLDARIASFNATVSSLASYARKADTTLGQLLRLNDYFCVNYQYDSTLEKHRPDEIFNTGSGVCQAYTLAYAAVLNELGIPNVYAESESMVHIWNMVQLNGSWYHIDVTWNDPTNDMALRARHEHFLRSDSGISDSGHYDWTASQAASATDYDSFFWTDISTPLSVVDDVVYYIPATAPENGSYTIHKWPVGGTSSQVASFSIVKSDGGYSYSTGYAPVCADSSGVYYGTNGNIYAIDHNGSEEPRLIYTTGDESLNFYSAWVSGGTVKMLAGTGVTSASVVSCSTGAEYSLAMEPVLAHMNVGDELQLSAIISPELDFDPEYVWTASSECVTVSETGLVTAAAPGRAEVYAQYAEGVTAKCVVAVHSDTVVTLPAGSQTIGAEAFTATSPVEVVIPEGATSIGEKAFAACEELLLITIPASVETIAEDAFDSCTDLTIICPAGSAAETYAIANGIYVISE